MEEQLETAEAPSWFESVMTPVGAEYTSNGGEVAASTPWGSDYRPKKYADMNGTERGQADELYKRWEEDDNFVTTDKPDGTKIYTDTNSGFSVNSDQLMLTKDAEGNHEVASMFDIGMFTGALAEAKVDQDVRKAELGLTTKGSDTTEGKLEADTTSEELPKPIEKPAEPSMQHSTKNGEVEIPTTDSTGKPLAEDEAVAQYERTGKTTAQEMLKTDLSNDTSIVGEAGKPIAGKPTAGSMPDAPVKYTDHDTGKEIELDDGTYDLKAIKEYAPKINQAVEAAMVKIAKSKGIQPGSDEYIAYQNAISNKFIGQAAEKFRRETVVDEPTEASPKQDRKVHWADRGSDSVAKTKRDTRTRYKNKYADTQNYGNYNNRKAWDKDFSQTINNLKTGKQSVASEKALDNLYNNEVKYQSLGIATPDQISEYESDKKIWEAKSKSMNTAAGRKAEREAANSNNIAEAFGGLDKALDADENLRPLDAVNLTRTMARKIKLNQGDKINKKDGEAVQAIKKRATSFAHLRKLASDADLEAMEKMSPIDRARQLYKTYFGGGNSTETKTKLAEMGRDQLVSETVKAISGAAASDQERAYIKRWMFGGEGINAELLNKVLNNLQFKMYAEAQDLGDTLYGNSRISALQELKNGTKRIAGMKYEDIDKEIKEALGKSKPIKRVNTPGVRRN